MQWKELYLILERVNKVEDTDHARIGFLICEIDILHRGTRNKKIKKILDILTIHLKNK